MVQPVPNPFVSYVQGTGALQEIVNLTPSDGDMLVFDTDHWATADAAAVKANLGL